MAGACGQNDVVDIPLYKSDLHPEALTLDDRLWQAGPVTVARLTALQSNLKAPSIIKRLRVVLPDTTDAASVDAAGFAVARTTRLIDLALPHPTLTQRQMPDGMTIAWHAPDADADWAAWCACHWAYYHRVHTSNPPVDPGPIGRHKMFVGDDLIAGLFVRNTQGALCGFASLRRDYQMGWIGVSRSGDTHMVPALLATCLRHGAALGWSTASLEVDDDDPALWRTVDAITDPYRTYLTWVWDRPQR